MVPRRHLNKAFLGDGNLEAPVMESPPFFVFSFFLYLAVLGLSFGIQDLLVAPYRISFPDRGSNLDPLHWEHRVLATGSPGKSLAEAFVSAKSVLFLLVDAGYMCVPYVKCVPM